jgi:hypothetical protein
MRIPKSFAALNKKRFAIFCLPEALHDAF